MLKEQAKDLGAKTRFSATEAASGMEFLAMAGWKTQDILKGMPGLLDLAASSNMDLGRAADITSNIISGFNMEASESTRVADVLAKGASTANTNVEQLGGAMKYAAPIANTLGLEIEGLTASVGFMSDAGIQGEQAGRQLRQGLLRLANPTKESAKLIDELGINVFDADGNMKEMHDVVGELERGFKGMDSQARTSALSILFGAESTAGWSTLLDRGSKDLKNYTKELLNSEGAAAEMAEVMQDNAKGAIIEFKSALEGAGIAASEHIIPAVTEITKKATELIRKFGDLDDEQQKQILKWLALTAAVGPTAIVLGHTTTALGGVMRVGGKLSKMLGRASGAGLIGRLGLLGGPAGVAILAGGALAFLGKKAYDAHKESQKLHDVSTETADRLWEQAESLEKSTDEFDKLRGRAKLTNDEFGRMIDIQKDLDTTQNPARVAELEKEYEELAKKSGLSNDELSSMIGLNKDIIDQSPNVEKSYTDQGNAIVESTDAVKEYIQSLKEMALIELEAERVKALENEAKLRERNKEIAEGLSRVEGEIQEIIDMRNMSVEEIDARVAEINDKFREQKLTSEEQWELDRERASLLSVKRGTIVETLDTLQEERDELIKQRDLNDEQLGQLDALNQRYAELLLSEVDINWEKGEGLKKLDDRIDKLQKERNELWENASEEDKRTGRLDEQLGKLDEQIRQHKSIRNKIQEETGYQSEFNLALSETAGKLSAQGTQIDKNNIKTYEGIKRERERTKEAGKDVTKNIKATDRRTIADIDRRAKAPVNKNVNLIPIGLRSLNNLASKTITRNVRLKPIGAGVGGGNYREYAKGTDHHPGGEFIAGEEGWELGRMGNRWEVLNFGLYDRPKGYEVFTHDESKRILRALNNVPMYADGARPRDEVNRVVSGLERTVVNNENNITVNATIRNESDIDNLTRKLDETLSNLGDRRRAAVGG